MKRAGIWAVVAFLVGVFLIVGGAYTRRGVPEWVLVVPLAFTCVGVLVRTRVPLVALALGAVGMAIDLAVGPSLPTVLVFTDNVYAAALYGPARFSRWLLVGASVLAVVAGAAMWFVTKDWRLLPIFGVQAGLVLITPVTTAMVLRQQRDQATAERARAEQVARLAEFDRQAAIAAERRRMARELHDMIANHFSAIAIQSTATLSRPDLDRETVRRVMESVRKNSVQGLDEMRAMIGLLRQEGDDTEAMRPRLADAEILVERVRRAGLAVSMRVEGEVRELPAPVDLAGYRILQEALTNALKHGDKSAVVTVDMMYESDRVTVSVDNSVPERGSKGELPGAGAGLVGMRERAVLVGGVFEAGVRGAEYHLWRVRTVLPTRTSALPAGVGASNADARPAKARGGDASWVEAQ